MLLKCKKCGKKLFIDLEEDVLLCEVCDEWSNIKPVLQYIKGIEDENERLKSNNSKANEKPFSIEFPTGFWICPTCETHVQNGIKCKLCTALNVSQPEVKEWLKDLTPEKAKDILDKHLETTVLKSQLESLYNEIDLQMMPQDGDKNLMQILKKMEKILVGAKL